MECLALRSAGVGVSVICPKGPDDPWRQEIEGVRIYKYPPPPAATGLVGYAIEFIYCWVMTALLSVIVAIRDRFGAIQACNPPDTFWALALLWRPFGKRFVFDQHDLNPEVYLSKFGQPTGIGGRAQLAVLRWLERMTYRTAQHVISTNESYKRVAIDRGQLRPEMVSVVRSGPDTTRMRPVEPRPELRKGRSYLAVYLGIMGLQDGVDQGLRALDLIVHKYGREDCHFALLGFGDCLEELKQLASELDLDDYVTFTGRVGPPEIADYLSSASVGICPDPMSPLNDVSTMNKTMEYMAYCVPIVSFDLAETRVSAADSATYVAPGDLDGFARAWMDLLDDPDERVRRGLSARDRVVSELDWSPQADNYVRVWSEIFDRPQMRRTVAVRDVADHDARGRRYVDLDDHAGLAEFIRRREP